MLSRGPFFCVRVWTAVNPEGPYPYGPGMSPCDELNRDRGAMRNIGRDSGLSGDRPSGFFACWTDPEGPYPYGPGMFPCDELDRDRGAMRNIGRDSGRSGDRPFGFLHVGRTRRARILTGRGCSHLSNWIATGVQCGISAAIPTYQETGPPDGRAHRCPRTLSALIPPTSSLL